MLTARIARDKGESTWLFAGARRSRPSLVGRDVAGMIVDLAEEHCNGCDLGYNETLI